MPKLTYSQKTRRVLSFLEGSVDPRVFGSLAGAGYSDGDIEEGWELLHKAGTARKTQRDLPPLEPRAREELDQFENYWFPLVSASLKRRHPEVHEQVFLNLSQKDGAEVAMNVSIFLERIQTAAKGPEGPAVMSLLNERGFTQDVIESGEQLVKDFRTVLPIDSMDLEKVRERHAAAVDELWDWYLEWSTIARTIITNRRHLRLLGFLSSPAERDDDPEMEEAAPESGVGSEMSGFELQRAN